MLSIFIFVFIFLAVHYLYFLIKIFGGLKKIKFFQSEKSPRLFISVIVPFRNESRNLIKSLRSIESQSYPKKKFEVIYVNDFSEDDSMEILSQAEKPYNVKIISVPENLSNNSYKKRAIKYGIENSLGEIIVTTDADCIHNKEWLSTLSTHFDEKTGFVSGPVKFNDDGTIFNRLQAIEFAGLVLAGAGLIGNGKPVICNAANIAYRRSAYEEVGGFKDLMNLSSGDDELLMQKIYKKTHYKIRFCWDANALVETEANGSLAELYQQRKRWASKGLFYPDKFIIAKLLLIFLFYLSLPLQIILAITWNWVFILTAILAAVIKVIMENKILMTGTSFLFQQKNMKYFYLAEIFHIPYIIITGISGLFGNYTWKKRKVKR